MKISARNLGPLKNLEFELGDLTIICGQNNTGKTYATYSLFGFLVSTKRPRFLDAPIFSYSDHGMHGRIVSDTEMEQLLDGGEVSFDLEKKAKALIDDRCQNFSRKLWQIFGSEFMRFNVKESKANFMVEFEDKEILNMLSRKLEVKRWTRRYGEFSIQKPPRLSQATILFSGVKSKTKMNQFFIQQDIDNILRNFIFDNLIPDTFISSAERTGAAIFNRELNFARNRLLEEMISLEDENLGSLLRTSFADYALPVKLNVEFIRNLKKEHTRSESFIAREHPEILKDFSDIIGGVHGIGKEDTIFYSPRGKRIKLDMNESSSTVRSLLNIGFYLKHVVEKGDLIIIDEPELNLHPENQRKIARLFARLVNIGIKVFITTHSDYIIKELNMLIMFNQRSKHSNYLAKQEGYVEQEFLDYKRIRFYYTDRVLDFMEGRERRTRQLKFLQGRIDSRFGIEAEVFDQTISKLNEIHNKLVWGPSNFDWEDIG